MQKVARIRDSAAFAKTLHSLRETDSVYRALQRDDSFTRQVALLDTARTHLVPFGFAIDVGL